MATTRKSPSLNSADNVLRGSFTDETATIAVSGFVTSKVGHKITLTLATTSVTDDTEIYRYFDGTEQVLELTIVYTDGTRSLLSSVERTA